MKSSLSHDIRLVFRKEMKSALRFRAAWAAMLMFALTTLACVSLAVQGGGLSPRLLAALYWTVLFFAFMAGIDRVFEAEDSAGTLLALRVYASADAVLFGKLLYTWLLLLVLAVPLTLAFLLLMDVTVAAPPVLFLLVLLGCWGMAAAGTLVAALGLGASVRGSLAPILLMPLMLPVFLPAIFVTSGAFGAEAANLSFLFGMGLYDAVLTVGASVLFPHLWYAD